MSTRTVNTDRTPEANPAVSPLESSKEKDRQRLMNNVKIADTPHPSLGSSCWNHGGAIIPKGGHRYFWYDGKGSSAHRASYRIHNGEIPSDMHVRHRCDNPACVNPDHLELGTHQQNMSDKALRGTAAVRAKSGILGIRQTASGAWEALVTLMNKAYTKRHKLKEDAIAWREAKVWELHGALVGYPVSRPLAAPAAQLALF